MTRIRPPQFLADLYRDLRDRRLLIPAAALVAALIAVPVLISRSGAEPAPPPTPSAAAGDATQVTAAVLAEQTGIRNYRRRLAALKRRNPFKQQFTVPPPSQTAIGEPAPTTGGGDSAATAGASVDAAASGGGSSDVSAGAPTEPSGPVEPTDQRDGSDGAKGSGDAGSSSPRVERRFYGYRADLVVGPRGEAEKLTGVRKLAFLPSRKDAFAAFLGASEDGKQATFLLDDRVIASSGDGRSLGGGPEGACQFLVLKPGEERILQLADGEPAQRLKLIDLYAVRIDPPKRREGSRKG